MGWVIEVTPRPLHPAKSRPATRCTGGWVDPSAGVDGCGKSRPPTGFDPHSDKIARRRVYHVTVSKKCPSDSFPDVREVHRHYFPKTTAKRLVGTQARITYTTTYPLRKKS
jgi:hypothetical protein